MQCDSGDLTKLDTHTHTHIHVATFGSLSLSLSLSLCVYRSTPIIFTLHTLFCEHSGAGAPSRASSRGLADAGNMCIIYTARKVCAEKKGCVFRLRCKMGNFGEAERTASFVHITHPHTFSLIVIIVVLNCYHACPELLSSLSSL